MSEDRDILEILYEIADTPPGSLVPPPCLDGMGWAEKLRVIAKRACEEIEMLRRDQEGG